MIYSFQLHRTVLWVILGLLCCAGFLVFAAGLLVGVSWQIEGLTQTAESTTTPIVATDVAVTRSLATPIAAPPPEVEEPTPNKERTPAPESIAPPPSVAPEPVAKPIPPAPTPLQVPLKKGSPTSTGTAFALQLGAFLLAENTQKLVGELEALGYEPYVVRLPASNAQMLESVRLGHFATRAEAAQAVAEVKRTDNLKAFIVRTNDLIP